MQALLLNFSEIHERPIRLVQLRISNPQNFQSAPPLPKNEIQFFLFLNALPSTVIKDEQRTSFKFKSHSTRVIYSIIIVVNIIQGLF